MNKKLILVAALMAAAPVMAQEWIRISRSHDGDEYSAKAGSFELTRNKAGRQIAVVVGSTSSASKRTTTYNKWYVQTSDCEAGMGKLVVLNVSGEFEFETEFVKGGRSVSAGIADTICALYDNARQRNQNKSL